MNRQAQELLLDLLELKVRYEEKEFVEVRNVLDSGEDEFLRATLELLQRLQVGGTKLKPAYVSVVESDRDQRPILTEIKKLLDSKKVFTTVKDLRVFVKEYVPATKSNDNKAAVMERYLQFLLEKSDEELELVQQQLISRSETKAKADVSKFMGMAKTMVESRKRK